VNTDDGAQTGLVVVAEHHLFVLVLSNLPKDAGLGQGLNLNHWGKLLWEWVGVGVDGPVAGAGGPLLSTKGSRGRFLVTDFLLHSTFGQGSETGHKGNPFFGLQPTGNVAAAVYYGPFPPFRESTPRYR
jgi:hypothetical protein